METTQEPQDFKHGGILFTDLPGCGTLKWPREIYIQNLNLLSYDCFLLITADRFTEDDALLFQKLSAMGKTCFVIRNKFDIAVENGQYDNRYSEDQVREIITSDTRDNLNSLGVNPVEKLKIYLISARHPTKYDFPELLNDIISALSGVKKQRFLADMQAYSNEILQQKREIAEQIV